MDSGRKSEKSDLEETKSSKNHVQFCLIASLIARVHGNVRSLSKSSWLVQPIT